MIQTGQLLLVVLGTVLLGVASGAIANRIRYRAEGTGQVLPKLILAIVVVNLLFFAARVRQLGIHTVAQSIFDATILLATLLTMAALFSQRNRAVLGLDGFLLPTACLIQFGAFAVVLKTPPVPDTAPWMVIHQLSLVLSATFFICGGLSGAVYLALVRTLRRKEPSPLLGRCAPLESWERVGRWCTLIGFSLFTLGILTGICRMAHLPPEQRLDWRADKFILLCLALWLTYGLALLVTWIAPSFRGRRAALLAVGSGAVLVLTFLVVDFLSVVHE